MKIIVISGSSRADSQSLKIANWLNRHLQKLEVEAEIVDLKKIDLPLRHDDIWKDISDVPAAKELREKLEAADGFVVISPEWHGMAAPALKNMFLYVQKTMAHKPALLTTVSATRYGGSYPLAELLIGSYKNSYLNYIPEHLMVREVNDMFNSDDLSEGSIDDQYIKHRAVHSLKLLIAYAEALHAVRKSGVPDYKLYPNGM